jgi:hypothetical protein
MTAERPHSTWHADVLLTCQAQGPDLSEVPATASREDGGLQYFTPRGLCLEEADRVTVTRKSPSSTPHDEDDYDIGGNDTIVARPSSM